MFFCVSAQKWTELEGQKDDRTTMNLMYDKNRHFKAAGEDTIYSATSATQSLDEGGEVQKNDVSFHIL